MCVRVFISVCIRGDRKRERERERERGGGRGRAGGRKREMGER